MLPVFSKKTSWILLTLLFVFDNLLSYWAIVYRGAHEANLSIAWLVEKYPLLYFLCIPLTLILIYVLDKFFVMLVKKIFKKVKEEVAERVILASIVFYWAIGNSSFNLFYLLGWHLPGKYWFPTTMITLVLAVIYTLGKLKWGLKSEK